MYNLYFRFRSGSLYSGPGFQIVYSSNDCNDRTNEVCNTGTMENYTINTLYCNNIKSESKACKEI